MSIYASACQECLRRNEPLKGTSAPTTSYWFWCVRDASCRKAEEGKLGLCDGFRTGEFCVQSDFYREGKTGGIGLNCACTSCTDPGCMRDYVDPSCKPLYSDCGCGSVSTGGRETVGNDPANRQWTRGELACEFRPRRVIGDALYSPPGTSGFVTTEELDMRRKAETLLHVRNSARLTAKQKWSQMVRGKGPLGPKAWGSQTQTVTTPNVRPCGTQSAFCAANPTDPSCGGCLPPNPKKPETSLLCTGPEPARCSPNTSADVPRSPIPELNLLCMDKSVPLTRFGRPNVVLSSADTKWPGGGWKPGMDGFPVGKAGANSFERKLAREAVVESGSSFENQSFKIKLPYFPGGAVGSRENKLTRCNRFAMSGIELTVCVRNGVASVPDIEENDVEFVWRPNDRIPFDPYGVGTTTKASGDGLRPGDGRSFRVTVGGSLRLFKHSSCTAKEEWGGVPWSENGAQDEEGEPGGAPTVREPSQMSSWCRGVLELVMKRLEIGTGDEPKPPNDKLNTCCGGGDLVIEGSRAPDIGNTRYTGALAWTVQEGRPSAGNRSTASYPFAVAPPDVASPWGSSSWRYSGFSPVHNWCSMVGGGEIVVPSDGTGKPFTTTLTGGSYPTTSTGGPSSVAWTGDTPVGPSRSYTGRGCGQPLTVGGNGYPLSSVPDCDYEGCRAAKLQTTYTTPPPNKGASDARKIQYPERFGGNWSPVVYKCDKDAQQNKTKTATSALSADGRYVTITWNFGAFSGGHPVSGGCDQCAKKPADVSAMFQKGGGMGQWLPWVAPGVPVGTADPLESPEHRDRGGMVPELYTFTWYIDTASLSSAESSQAQVPCFGIVTGKPSSGPLIDPRPCLGGYVDSDNRKFVDINRAGGGWLGNGGSVVGTRAGGLGLRGCLKHPVCDVWGQDITVELCQ